VKSFNRPNILLAISDDQGWPYAGAYGAKFIHTPAFNWIAREGILFNHGYCPAPQCAPSRAALLTGRNLWQNQEAATHNGDFPAHLKVYPDLLEEAGYHIGYTGKPWGPGSWENGGRTRNPAGPEYNSCRLEPPTTGISSIDYAGNFEEFIRQRPEGKPFCFWFGCQEPHRPYEWESGVKSGKSLEEVDVPEFLPDVDEVQNDFLDYALEIEWFDQHLFKMLEKLKEMGELDNTIIVVTSDNVDVLFQQGEEAGFVISEIIETAFVDFVQCDLFRL
jgi:N-sulfoglucosamine sulfohydrolase